MNLEEDLNKRLVAGVCCRLQTKTGIDKFYWRVGFVVLHFVYLGTWIYMGAAIWMNMEDESEAGE